MITCPQCGEKVTFIYETEEHSSCVNCVCEESLNICDDSKSSDQIYNSCQE